MTSSSQGIWSPSKPGRFRGVLALGAAIINWVATLISGASPRLLHGLLSTYVRYQLHVGAFLYLVDNPFPGFVGAEGSYPTELHIAGPEPQSRWTVVFRLALALPTLVLLGIFGWLLFVTAVLGWVAALITGRMPFGLRNAGALALRYTAQAYGYILLLTSSYPYSGPCHERPPALAPMPQPPMLASRAV